MPTSFLSISLLKPRRYKLIILFLFLPLIINAQSLTGLWIGALSNDSNTVRKDQSFEIALTEYKGKVYGYSRSEFIVDDVLYFVVKRVKGTIEGDICEVKDDEIIAFNFPTKLDKGVKVTSIFRRNQSDSTWYLDGTWKTNKTKNYYAVTGKVSLEEEKDLTASKIFPHLEELKIADEIAFYKERKEGIPVVKIVKPEKPVSYAVKEDVLATKPTVTALAQPLPATASVSKTLTEQSSTEPEPTIAGVKEKVHGNENSHKTISNNDEPNSIKTKDAPVIARNTVVIEPAPIKEPQIPKTETADTKTRTPDLSERRQPVVVANNKNVVNQKPVTKNDPPLVKTETRATRSSNPPENKAKEKSPVINNPIAKNTKSPVVQETKAVEPPTIVATNTTIEKKSIKNEVVSIPVIAPVKTSLAERNGAAASINERKTEVSQVVQFASDSLELALYDNGQIDGDTVSVLMNGEVLLSKQGLKASAIRKTIYITPGKDDEFTLVLYAENLGTYPPNTGLLVVHDGEDVYNLRFSSDFQKNAGIVFRRKNKN